MVGKHTNALWIALLFLSSSWLFTLYVFTRPNYWVGGMLLASGAALSVFALRNGQFEMFDRKYGLFLVPLAISSIFIPFPYNLGPILLAVGIAAGCINRRVSFAGAGLVFSGILLTLQAAVLPFFYAFASRYHSAGAVAPFTNALMNALGVKTHLNGSTAFTEGTRNVFAVSVTWEKLGLFPMLLVLIGGIAILLMVSSRKRKSINVAIFIGTLFVYTLIRYVFLVLIFNEAGKLSIFWNPVVTAVSIVPLFLVLMKILPVTGVPVPGPLKMERKAWLMAGAAFICVFLFVGVFGFYDPGTKKRGRILVDEKHSNWEWTTEKYDTKWYGEKSGYNYYSLYTYLGSFYHVDRNFKTLTPSVLSKYDILILKTPTSAYSPDEVESIKAFVKKGGGLCLISDHTNVFGMSNFINPVARSFGLRFRYDATYDLNSGALTEYSRPKVMPHPIVQHMPPFLFGTSCTLEAPLTADSVITGYGLKSMYADYSQKNFFPDVPETPAMDFGLGLQAAAVKHGRGRVFAFTDSTVFSNFWMFMPGKPELALGAMEWLNRTGHATGPALYLALACLLFLGVTIYLTLEVRGHTAFLVLLTAALLAVPTASFACGAINRSTYPLPKPRTKFTRVSFEQAHSDFALPTLLKGFLAKPEKTMQTFYVWTQRLGYVPSVYPSLGEAVRKGDMVVIINSSKPFTDSDRADMVQYVRHGGRLLVMDGAGIKNSTSNQLLKSSGMRIDHAPIGESAFSFEKGYSLETTPQACSISGGKPIVSTETGKTICAISRMGRGTVLAFSDSGLFSDAQMGFTNSWPVERQLKISELEFWLVKGLKESKFGGNK